MAPEDFRLMLANWIVMGKFSNVAIAAIALLVMWDWENWGELEEPEQFDAMGVIVKEMLGLLARCPECGEYILPGHKIVSPCVCKPRGDYDAIARAKGEEQSWMDR